MVRDDGDPDIYLPANEMRAVLHRDRVKVRIVRQDRRGRVNSTASQTPRCVTIRRGQESMSFELYPEVSSGQ